LSHAWARVRIRVRARVRVRAKARARANPNLGHLLGADGLLVGLVVGERALLRHHVRGEGARELGLRGAAARLLLVLGALLVEHRVEARDVALLLLLDHRRQLRALVLVELVQLVVRLGSGEGWG